MKIIRIEYNVRPIGDHGNLKFDSIAFEDALEEGNLIDNGIHQEDVCLMSFDNEGIHPMSDIPVLYDMALVKTNKPVKYWTEHFK